MFKFLKYTCAIFLVGVGYACKITHRTVAIEQDERSALLHLRDSLLQNGLEGEALYTLMAPIKPMSSVASFSFPVGNSDSTKRLEAELIERDSLYHLKRVKEIQQAINLIDLPDLKFVLVPYRSAYTKTRILQLSVVRISKMDSLLAAKQSFFGQYGFSSGTDPAVVVTVNEYEKKYQRLRGYGYLFGYPDYAVDFFVKAFHEADSTGNLVPRDFFRIPTYGHEEGNFVYAYPKDHTPNEVDAALLRRSVPVLETFQLLRPRYLNADSTLRAYELLRNFTEK